MSRLTQKQERHLRGVLYHLTRAQAFIASERVTICVAFGGVPSPITKEIGSDLTGLPMAIESLQQFLKGESQ